ncbi:MAG: hypothetical protein IT515_12340 [Burkholderiales bacterium]|nr:hypothetical protein [Burkholderiales bacterium]
MNASPLQFWFEFAIMHFFLAAPRLARFVRAGGVPSFAPGIESSWENPQFADPLVWHRGRA